VPTGDSSNLTRFQPRHAVIAASPPHKQHQRVVAEVNRKIARRQARLPLTHIDFIRRTRP
jgi:hypothetical protein